MSWASKRRFLYIGAFVIFCVIVFGIPIVVWLHRPSSCFDGKQDGGETAIDKGGPCALLDERYLAPHSTEWARSFKLRDGLYNATAYVSNSNSEAGVIAAPYRFLLYDENNIEIAERRGTTVVMPNATTPIFEGSIETGNRNVSRTFFEFTAPLVWERVKDTSADIVLSGKQTELGVSPLVSATAQNTSVTDVTNLGFVAVVFDTSGNAMAASETELTKLPAGKSAAISFTWPQAFPRPVGHVDITPLIAPQKTE